MPWRAARPTSTRMGIQSDRAGGTMDTRGLSMDKYEGRRNTRIRVLARAARSGSGKDGGVEDDPDDLWQRST